MACSGYRNTDYSMLWVFLAMIVICVITLAGPYVEKTFQSINNDLMAREQLQDLETAFQGIHHPAGTEPSSARNFKGEFTGREQGCDFFVGEIRSYSNGQDDVLSSYSAQVVAGNPVHTLFLEDGQIPGRVSSAFPESLHDLADWQLPEDVGQQQLYLVYVIAADYGEFDCR